MFGNIHGPIFVEIRSQSANTDLLMSRQIKQKLSQFSCLKLLAEVREELYPELAVVHVVEPHLPLDLGADQVPALVPVTPLAAPLVLVPPGVPHPDQADPVSAPVLPVIISQSEDSTEVT